MFWIKEHISSHLYLDFFKQRRIIRIFIQIEGFQYLSSLGSKQYEEHMVSWRPPKNLRKRHSSHWLAWIYNWKDGQKRGMSECRNAGTLLKNNRGTAPELDGSEQDSSVVAARDFSDDWRLRSTFHDNHMATTRLDCWKSWGPRAFWSLHGGMQQTFHMSTDSTALWIDLSSVFRFVANRSLGD